MVAQEVKIQFFFCLFVGRVPVSPPSEEKLPPATQSLISSASSLWFFAFFISLRPQPTPVLKYIIVLTQATVLYTTLYNK